MIEAAKKLGWLGCRSNQTATDAGKERLKLLDEAKVPEYGLYLCDDLGRYRSVSFTKDVFTLVDAIRKYEVVDMKGAVVSSSDTKTGAPKEAERIYAVFTLNGTQVVTASFKKATCRAVNDLLAKGHKGAFHLRTAQAPGKSYPMSYFEACDPVKGAPDPADLAEGAAWLKSRK